MEPFEEEQLIEELRALRPTPHPEFAAELDQRAAAGFPRRSRLRRLAFSLPRRPALRLLLPAGGVAVIAIAVAGALIATNESEKEPTDSGTLGFLSAGSPSDDSSEPVEETAAEPSPEIEKYQRATAPTEASGAAELQPFSANLNSQSSHPQRAVERSARIVLGSDPASVAEDAAEVLAAVHAYDGIVMRSSSHQGPEGEAGAHFELRFPSAKLGGALAALSEIGELRSRYDTSLDITAPTVAVGELLQDSKARIDSLLGQLEEADTESEREAVEAELRQERRHRARLRADLQRLQRHAEFSRVKLRIDTDAVEDSSGGGAWGVDDALRDAGKILGTAAAIALVTLAVIAPIALLSLLAWLAYRAWVRRERRRVLS